MNEAEAKIAETLKKQAHVDAMGKVAAGLAQPGVLKDVFAVCPDIQVGKYSVRPIYDADFEFLQHLQHPFAALTMGETKEVENFVPRGQEGWTLMYMLTRSVEEAEAKLKEGKAAFEAAAKAEFGRYQLPALLALFTAIVKQLNIYSGAALQYEGATLEEEGDKDAPSKAPKDQPAQ